jgi:hypothetical protein
MVTVDSLLAWLRRVTGYIPTAWSLVRIAVVVVMALAVAGLVLPDHPGQTRTAPYNLRLATPTTRNVALPLNDPRGFKPSNHPHRFKVAWIGGSELLGVDPRHPAFIPRLVNDRIGKVGGKRADTDIYFLNAIRLADEYSAESAAVAAKPDMLVISLNPVWVLNDLAVQQWDYLDGVLARGTLWPPSSWPVLGSLISPGDVGWRALSSLSRPVQQRYDWGVKASNRTGSFTFLDSKTDKAPPPLTELGAFAQKRPVDFWFSHFASSSTSKNLSDVQLRIMERELASKSAMNTTVLRQMFDMAHRAGIPTYFYVPPIDPKVYARPDGVKYVAGLRTMLADATKDRTNTLVSFDPKGLQDRVPAAAFEDIVHVKQPRPEATVLAHDLCALLRANGRQPECEGR